MHDRDTYDTAWWRHTVASYVADHSPDATAADRQALQGYLQHGAVTPELYGALEHWRAPWYEPWRPELAAAWLVGQLVAKAPVATHDGRSQRWQDTAVPLRGPGPYTDVLDPDPFEHPVVPSWWPWPQTELCETCGDYADGRYARRCQLHR